MRSSYKKDGQVMVKSVIRNSRLAHGQTDLALSTQWVNPEWEPESGTLSPPRESAETNEISQLLLGGSSLRKTLK